MHAASSSSNASTTSTAPGASGPRDLPARVRSPAHPRWLGWPGAALCIAIHLALAGSSALLESPTFDEGFHLTSGYVNWLQGDYRLHSGNGLLAQSWFALPLVLARDSFRFPNPDRIIETQTVRDFHELTVYLAHVFFYEVGNDPAKIMRYGRSMALLIGAAICALVYAWARRAFGAGPALLACALCALSPNVLAHARLTTSDLLFSFALLAAVGLAWESFWRPSPLRVAAAGLALGLLALTKLSALGAIPILALLVGVRAVWSENLSFAGRRLVRPAARALALLGVLAAEGLLAVAVIWGAYGLRFDAVPEGRVGREAMDLQWAWALDRESRVLSGIELLRDGRLLPEAYLYSAAFVWRRADERRSFFRGSVSSGGDWRFFPYAIAVKTPLGLFALLALAALALVRPRRATRSGGFAHDARGAPVDTTGAGARAHSLTPLAAIAIVHGGAAVTSEINLGLRHVLPLYAVAFIVAGAAALGWRGFGYARRAATLLAAAAFAAASLSIWPHYLAYFNAWVGPDQGYRHLVDSSLDWGQDLDGLRRWLDANHAGELADREPVYLAYFGTADPLYHGLDVQRLPGFIDWPSQRDQWSEVRTPLRLEPGLYAISATILQQVMSALPSPLDADGEREYAHLRRRFAQLRATPEATAAQSLRQVVSRPPQRAAWQRFRELRLARLCQALRAREPDANVGYSILLYRVGRDELARALAPRAYGESGGGPVLREGASAPASAPDTR